MSCSPIFFWDAHPARVLACRTRPSLLDSFIVYYTSDLMKPTLLRTGAQETRWFVRLLAGLALFAMSATVNEWLTPSAPPFRGRLAWVIESVFALAGTAGLVGLWLLVAVVLTTTARFVWRHTARLPTDRWLW